jgi:type VI secretion system secreted protein Hcp
MAVDMFLELDGFAGETVDAAFKSKNGKHVAKGTLTVRKAGEKPLDYLKISMTDILVSSVETGSQTDDERQIERLTLNFAKVKMEYFMQSASGGKEPGGEMAYDIAGNAKV